jgi:hypothetical protein
MKPSPYSANSRYFSVALRTRTAPDGTVTQFAGRRIIPAIARYRPLDRYRTEGDERIDLLAAEFYGDAEQYWRICDANGVEDPADATAPEGRILIVPLPLEVSGNGDA